MLQDLDKFIAKINKGDMAWVYNAGHGVQANERNYRIPVDFMGEESDLDYDACPPTYCATSWKERSALAQRLAIDPIDSDMIDSRD